MTLKTPGFWYRKHGTSAPVLERTLTPLSWLYGMGHRINKNLQSSAKAQIPVICIGNAVAGGSGKTPTALALMELVLAHNIFKTPYFLSRGYGGTLKGPTLVDHGMKAHECGDEPLLLSKAGKTVVARNRVEGAAFCVRSGGDAILLDDGLQNASLYKDLSFLVIDGAAGFGNGRLIPAGPLRETLDMSFANTDAFVLISQDSRYIKDILPRDKPLFQAHIKPMIPDDLDLARPVVGFAGLGRPEKFYHMLQGLGATIAGWNPFPDHHPYSEGEIEKLALEAKLKNAQLVTTEKDAVRIGPHTGIKIFTLPITLEFENTPSVVEFLSSRLKGGS